MLVCVNAGHGKGKSGGVDPGAIGPNGLKEATVTRDVAIRLGNLLRAYKIKTIGTDRPTAPDYSYIDIVSLANENNADITVSIHCNAATNRTAKGTEVFYWQDGKDLADMVRQSVTNQINDKDRRPDNPKKPWYNWMPKWTYSLTDRGTKAQGFYVIRATKMPAVLVEIAFISNPTEERLLESNTFKQQIAQAIADAIFEYGKRDGLI